MQETWSTNKTIDLIKQNVNGIMDDKFKVSTSFGGDENLIIISIDATFVTESDMKSMIDYADNQLIIFSIIIKPSVRAAGPG